MRRDGFGRIDALIVNTVDRGPGQMLGMGDGNPIIDLLDHVTGGEISSTQSQLASLQLALKVSIAASILAGVVSLGVLFSGKAWR